MRSHVIRLALFTLIQPQLPRPLTFPFPISTNTYYSRDLKGISKSARACKSILAARAHSGILKYLGDFEPRSYPARAFKPRGASSRAGSCPTLLNRSTLSEYPASSSPFCHSFMTFVIPMVATFPTNLEQRSTMRAIPLARVYSTLKVYNARGK